MSPNLTSVHEPYFAAALRSRGQDYFARGAVQLLDLTETRAIAIVRGGRPYGVQLTNFAEPRRLEAECDCPAFADHFVCKHVWATLLAIDEVLQSMAEAERELAAVMDEFEPASAPVPRAAKHPLALVRPPRPKAPTWRERLEALAPRDAAAPGPGLVVEYFVEMPPAESWAEGVALVVQVRKRLRRKNGQFGAPRATRVELDELAQLPAADRAVLALYQSDQRARSWGGSYRGVGQAGMSIAEPWFLSAAVATVAVPWLAKTGHTFRGPAPVSEAMVAVPLRFDTDESFRFEVVPEARTGAKAGRVRIGGALVRGDQRLPLDAVPGEGDERYLLVEDRLVRVDLGGGGELARDFVRRGPIEVDADEAAAALASMARLRGARQFLAQVLPALPLGRPEGAVALRLPKVGMGPVPALLQFDYAGITVHAGSDHPLVEGVEGVVRRDLSAEGVLRQQAVAAGLQEFAGGLQCARATLPQVVGALVAAGLRVFAEGKPLRPFQLGKATVGSGLDWFEVVGKVEFAGHVATVPELLRRKTTPDGFVELGDGSYGLLPAVWARRIETLRLLGGQVDGEVLRLPNSQALLLDAMLEAKDEDVVVDRKFTALRRRLAAFRRVEPQQEPAGFQGELRPYQRQGLGWLQFLHEFGLGGCLADDMGLGKTVQLLAHLLAIRKPGARERRPHLLVAPRSVLPNWLAEAQRFAPALRVVDFSGPDRWREHGTKITEYDLVLTTYALVRTDAVPFAERNLRFGYVVLDEAQMAKNADSQTSKAVRLLGAQHRLALTGTPVENHLGELWSLFEFLNPGMLGRLQAFRGLFGRDVDAEAMRGHRELVQRALRPVLLRRTKAQVLTDLPEKVEQTLWCDLEPAQRQRYEQLRRHFRDLLLDGAEVLEDQKRFAVLEALLRLRQAACHEGLLDPKRRSAPSAKLEVLLPRLEELAAEGHKVLVFSQFTTFLDLVEPALTERGIGFCRLDGQTRDRPAAVRSFQEDPQCAVFLISLKAGGFGLNLTAADYVFVLDPWWNPAAELQAIDRAHRIGQRRTVHAYRLVCRGTVEERVLELQQQKKALCEAILGNERSLLQDLTRADLDALLG